MLKTTLLALVLGAHPGSSKAHAKAPPVDTSKDALELAQKLSSEGNLDGAAEVLHSQLQAHPEDAQAHKALGAVEGSRGNVDEAEREYKEFLRLSPNAPEAKSIRKLLEGLDQARSDRPAAAPAAATPEKAAQGSELLKKAEAAERAGQLELAIELYQDVASHDRKQFGAYLKVAELYARQHQNDQAANFYKLFLNAAPASDPRVSEAKEALLSLDSGSR